MRAPSLAVAIASRSRSVGGVLIAVALALALITGVSLFVPSVEIRFTSLALELVVDTVSAVVTIVVAMLSWARYREDGRPITLFQAAAFLVLGVGNTTRLLLVIASLEPFGGR